MFKIFKNIKKSNICEDLENNNREYQIIVGENMVPTSSTTTSSTLQSSQCHNQNDFSESHSTSLEGSSSYGSRIFRDYTSSPHIFLLVLFLGIYVLLMLLGASVFALFEQRAEFDVRDHILRIQQNLLAKNPCLDAESLDAFVKAVIDAYINKVNLHQLNQIIKAKQENGQDTLLKSTTQSNGQIQDNRNLQTNDPKQRIKYEGKHSNGVSTQNPNHRKLFKSKEFSKENTENIEVLTVPMENSNWEFTSSLLFVTTLVTTIGYGHIAPITIEGKIFCLVFSCVAIPFTLVFLSIIVSLLKNGPVKRFEKWLIRVMTSNFRNFPEIFIRILNVVIVTMALVLIILIIPALIFYNIEKDWSLLDSFYYCYISLTTVGLGDFVPTTAQLTKYPSLDFYRICLVIYLYGGLSLIMLWIAVILRIPQMNLKPFLLTEKEEIDERTQVIDYTKEGKTYGTNIFPQK